MDLFNYLHDFDDYDLEYERPTPGGYIPNHLSSPITDEDCIFLLNNDEFHCKRHRLLGEKIKKENVIGNIYEHCHDPYVCLKNFIENTQIDEDLNIGFNKCVDSSLESYKLQLINFLENSLTSTIMNNIETKVSIFHNEIVNKKDLLLCHYINMKKVEKINDHLCLTRCEFGKLIKCNLIEAERDIFIFNCPDHGKVIGPTNLLLCTLDIYQSRFSLIYQWTIQDIMKRYPYSMLELGLKLIEVFEGLRLKIGRDVYKILATWESYIVGFSIKDPINDLGFSELYETADNEIKTILAQHNLNLPKILTSGNSSRDLLKLYLEMTRLIKHFGHPCLKVKEGFETVREFGTEQVTIDNSVVEKGVSIFKRDFIKNYFDNRSRWPPLKKKLSSRIKK